MNLLIILIVLLVLFGGGGWYGRGAGWYTGNPLAGYGMGGLGLVLFILVILALLGRI